VTKDRGGAERQVLHAAQRERDQDDDDDRTYSILKLQIPERFSEEIRNIAENNPSKQPIGPILLHGAAKTDL